MTTAPSNPTRKPAPATPLLLLGACYPVSAHVAALSGRPGWIAASIGLLVLTVLAPGLLNRRPLAWALLLAAGLGLHAAAASGQALLLLFLPPVLINAFMAWVFGHTLRRGQMPLIERIVRAMHGPDDNPGDDIRIYARRLTLVWTVLFVVLAIVNAALAALARPGGLLLAAGIDPRMTVPLGAWSLFANVLNYAIVATLFVLEYQVRQRRFPQQPYRGLLDFTRRLAALRDLFRPVDADRRARRGQ